MNHKPARGMTLLELVVVLAILAVVTSIAVASFTAVEDQSRLNATQQQLTEIEIAILGEQGLRMPNDKHQLVNGFVADMGRRPALLDHDSNSTTNLQPAELWIPPSGLAPYSLRSAVLLSGNITSAFSTSDGLFASAPVNNNFEDGDVFLPCGWRGPYLRVSNALDVLRDGWGNALQFLQPNGTDLSTAGEPIAVLRTLGSDGMIGATNPSEMDRNLVIQSPVQNRTVAALAVTLKSTVTANEVRVYSPDPDTGKIRVYKYTGSPTTYAFGELPIGPKVIRAYNSGTPATKPYSVSLPPGGLPSLELE